MYLDLEPSHGEQKQQIGTLRGDLDATKNDMAMLQSQMNQQPAPVQAPPDYSGTDSKFLDEPTKTTYEIVQESLKAYDAYRRVSDGRSQASWAKETARQKWPEAFEGVNDADIDKLMFTGADSGNINPDFLKSPEAWVGTAWQVKGQKMGFKAGPVPPTPTEPIPTEGPVQTRKIEEPKGADTVPDYIRQQWKSAGITDEQQKNIINRVSGGDK